MYRATLTWKCFCAVHPSKAYWRTLDFLWVIYQAMAATHSCKSTCPDFCTHILSQSNFAPTYVFNVNFLWSQPLAPASQLLRCLLRDWCGRVVGKSIPRLAESDSKVHSKSINKCKVQTILLWHNCGAHKSFFYFSQGTLSTSSST